jgi:hypothetical protein
MDLQSCVHVGSYFEYCEGAMDLERKDSGATQLGRQVKWDYKLDYAAEYQKACQLNDHHWRLWSELFNSYDESNYKCLKRRPLIFQPAIFC